VTAPRRRDLLAGGGLVVFFALTGTALAQDDGQSQGLSGGGEGGGGPKKVRPDLPGSLATQPELDAWIRIAPDGHATVFTGKVELGQGIKTALMQLAIDELDLPDNSVTLVTADTGRTPDEGITAGSHSMQDSGTAILNAAANVRHLLAAEAARRWNAAPETLFTRAGTVRAPDGRSIGYGELAATLDLHVAAQANVSRVPSGSRRFIGRSVPRVDIPAKLTGGRAYVHDLVLPHMLHGRVVRGPSEGTRLVAPDLAGVARLPGIAKVVRDGTCTAILAEREWPLIQALEVLNRSQWQPTKPPFPPGDLATAIQHLPSQTRPILDRHDAPGSVAVRRMAARYTRPYLMHGSIGPSCAVALFENDTLQVWTHSQGVYPLRKALAELLRMPVERIRCIHAEGAGCYGHNGADDVAADAALAARAVPGRPVRMQWMREHEHGWEPLGPGMVTELSGALDASGRIVGWRHEVWSSPHNSRPRTGAGLYPDAAQADPAARGRWRPQRGAALCLPQRRRGPPLHSRDAAAHVRTARARRTHERVLDRKLHGRARRRRAPRSDRLPAGAHAGPACAGGDPRRRRQVRLDPLSPAARPRRWLCVRALQEPRCLLRRRARRRG
jgi:nicotinate dehydrogenase subunit B